MPVRRKNSPHVQRLPSRLRKGTLRPPNDRTPSVTRSACAADAAATRRMSSGRCCPSASAVTTPAASGKARRISANAVLSAAPLPRFAAWRIRRTPGRAAVSAKVAAEAPLFGEGVGLDSIDALEIGAALRKKFQVKFKANAAENKVHFRSIASLADFIAANLGETLED